MHHFISYSTVDAQDFALKLADALVAGHPTIPVWIDKLEEKKRIGKDWDEIIDKAILSCESLIFVMTLDSVEDVSPCKNEWSQALAYKKPIIPLMLQLVQNFPSDLIHGITLILLSNNLMSALPDFGNIFSGYQQMKGESRRSRIGWRMQTGICGGLRGMIRTVLRKIL